MVAFPHSRYTAPRARYVPLTVNRVSRYSTKTKVEEPFQTLLRRFGDCGEGGTLWSELPRYGLNPLKSLKSERKVVFLVSLMGLRTDESPLFVFELREMDMPGQCGVYPR